MVAVLTSPAVLAAQGPAAPAAVDTSRHRLGMVTVHGVRIPYLDWGGEGVARVFVPGMGNSAHVFDDYAPRFVDASVPFLVEKVVGPCGSL